MHPDNSRGAFGIMKHMKISQKLILRKYQTQIIIGVIAVLVLAGFVWAARPTSSDRGSDVGGGDASVADGLTVSERSFDFGTISMAAGKVRRTVSVKNASSAPLTISKIYTSCMCTEASWLKGEQKMGPFGMPMHGPIPRIDQTLAPGEEAAVEIVFDPAAHGPAGVGYIKRVVSLEDPQGAKVDLTFNAMVTP